MKTSLFVGMLQSTLFYTTLLSTTFVMPLVLAVRGDATTATVHRNVRASERPLDAPSTMKSRGELCLPQTVAPIDKSCGPDAVMIKPGKARAKTIRV